MIESEIGIVTFLIVGSGLIGAIFAVFCCFILDITRWLYRQIKSRRGTKRHENRTRQKL